MKPTHSIITALLALLLVAGGFSTKAQEDSCAVNVIHTYMNGRLIPWDSVEVRVCMPPCEYPYHYQTFKMYWPDTILANCATRIDEYVAVDKLELSQNYPNPCQGESSVKLTTRMSGSVRLQVMDVQGRLCCQRTETLPAGEHTLSLTFAHSGLYFVTAETAEGRATCKVLCSEGKGSAFGIRLSSTSPQLVEKTERGGEGMFNMTDELTITAFITYNDSVWSRYWLFNEYYLNDSLYHHGSVNIHFYEYTGCDSFSLSGQTYNIIIRSHASQPFTDYPIGGTVDFYDSTFFATPGIHFQQLSSTWTFDGWYKYRFYPNQNAQWGRMWICQMDKNLPPADSEPTDYQTYTEYYIRGVFIYSCEVLATGIATLFSDSTLINAELMIKEE